MKQKESPSRRIAVLGVLNRIGGMALDFACGAALSGRGPAFERVQPARWPAVPADSLQQLRHNVAIRIQLDPVALALVIGICDHDVLRGVRACVDQFDGIGRLH